MKTLIIKKKEKNYKDIFNQHLLNVLKMRNDSTKDKLKPNTVTIDEAQIAIRYNLLWNKDLNFIYTWTELTKTKKKLKNNNIHFTRLLIHEMS